MTPSELAIQWRADADVLERRNAPDLARVYRSVADELDAALRAVDDDTLSLAEAAEVSGYSLDRLRHKVTAGEIPNAGRKGKPLIRRGDLPSKKRRTASGRFNPEDAARALLRREA